MNFPKRYFYDEVREGFYIDGMVKREWAAQMETLEEIDKVCKKHGIKWFADCGTLLGAVRHGGYVPWDDDLDICMLRDDYRKFHELAVPELPETFEVLTYEREEYWQMITRVTNEHRISYKEDHINKYHQFFYVAGIDIFVLDYVAPNPTEEEVRRQLVNSVISIGSIEGIDGDDPPQEGLELISMVEENCNVKLDRKNHLKLQLYQLAERLSCLYPSKGAKEVVLMPYWCSDHDHKYPIEFVNKIVQIPFENIMINVPAGYDAALKIEYGDYLKICRKGGLHEYPLYEKQESFLVEKLETENPYRYNFKPADMEINKDPRPKRLYEQLRDYCALLQKIHVLFRDQEAVLQSDPFELLEQCQDGLIKIGTQIEAQEGEGFITIGFIEDYCERLYAVSVVLENGGDPGSALDDLDDSLNRLYKSANEDMEDVKEILFLPFSSDYWKTMEPAYKEAISDHRNRVYVIPVPFYDRKAGGELGEMHYDTDGYPAYIDLTDYKQYDIRSRHPDVIYIQNAYDKYNYTYIIEPQYFTSELAKYTEKLIYIPYFRIGKFDWGDEKLMKTTEFFLKIPGVVNSDSVIVESDDMRELYIKVLTEMAGEQTKSYWEKKIIVEEWEENAEDKPDLNILPESWRQMIYKDDGSRKKTVLFMNAFCSMYQYKKQAIEKLRSVLNTFKERSDEILLIWRPHSVLKDSNALLDREIWKEYCAVLEEYVSGKWGILDESDDPEMAISAADAYYGDPDPVMQKCRNLGMPVMIASMSVL